MLRRPTRIAPAHLPIPLDVGAGGVRIEPVVYSAFPSDRDAGQVLALLLS